MGFSIHSRRGFLAGLSGAGIAGSCFGGVAAALYDAESVVASVTAGTWDTVEGRVAHTDGGNLRTVTESSTGGLATSGVDVIGPVEAGFDGSDYHVPVVDGSSNLLLVAADGSHTTLVSGSASDAPRGTKSALATAAWNGHPRSVYYPGSGTLFRVAPGASPKRVSEPSNGVKAALGAGDLDGDGTDEFAFVDGSGTVRYITPADADSERDIRSTGKSPGSNANFGAGAPVAIDGYGVVLPAVNGSGAVGLLGPNGWVNKSLTSGSTAKKTAVHGCDFDGDGNVEIVFAGYSNGYLSYLSDIGGSNDVTTVTDGESDHIPVDPERGVR